MRWLAPLLGQLAALAVLLCASAYAAPAPLAGAERAAALTLANKALNVAGPLQGRFVQIGPNGKAAPGAFYLQRPGKVRFEYDAPNPMTIVADGSVVSIEDRALKTVNRAPLNTTPLDLVLRRGVDLARDAKITGVARDGDRIWVSLRDKPGRIDGELTLVFDRLAGELREWRVKDVSGATTLTALQTVQHVGTLNPKLFATKAPPPSPRSR